MRVKNQRSGLNVIHLCADRDPSEPQTLLVAWPDLTATQTRDPPTRRLVASGGT